MPIKQILYTMADVEEIVKKDASQRMECDVIVQQPYPSDHRLEATDIIFEVMEG